MANYVYNTLTIRKADAHNVLRTNDNGEKNVDFNILLPLPKELLVSCDTDNSIDIYTYLSNMCRLTADEVATLDEAKLMLSPSLESWEITAMSEDDIKTLIKRKCDNAVRRITSVATKYKFQRHYDSGKTLVENYRKYGATTWYTWCTDHWGTTKNAYDTEVSEHLRNNSLIIIRFTTVWSPPDNWLHALVNKHVPFDIVSLEGTGCMFAASFDGNSEMVQCDGTMQTYGPDCDEYPSDEEIASLEKDNTFISIIDDDSDPFDRMLAVNNITRTFPVNTPPDSDPKS